MFIESFKALHPKHKFLDADNNGRSISIYEIDNCEIISENLHYPNILLYNGVKIINPLDEKIMSLKDVNLVPEYRLSLSDEKKIVNTPLFYFVYNYENYYHFVYDTLPYLISFFHLKKKLPNIKLLVNYPNNKENFYSFNLEFFKLFELKENDFIFVEKNTKYEKVYITESFTYGDDPNIEPRNEIYDFLKSLVKKIKLIDGSPKKIYVSRRSWIHNDLSNIGTNYTDRRKMINEDKLVEYLSSVGFVEVFTEKMSIEEKINLFRNVEVVVGPIGGGMCNVVFSPNTTKVIPIVSPTFLDVNQRFKFTFKNTETYYFNETTHTEDTFIKKFMRVKYKNIVGEVCEIDGDNIKINYTDSLVSGWAKDNIYKNIVAPLNELTKLDNGLNSEWCVEINKFKKFYEGRINNVSSGLY